MQCYVFLHVSIDSCLFQGFPVRSSYLSYKGTKTSTFVLFLGAKQALEIYRILRPSFPTREHMLITSIFLF